MSLSRILNPAVCLALTLTAGNAYGEELLKGTIDAVRKDHVVLTVAKTQHTIQVDAATKITLDGKPATLADLKSTYDARIAFKKEGKLFVATKIEARSKTAGFFAVNDKDADEKLFRGSVDSVAKTLVVLRVEKRLEKISVNDETVITLDRKAAKLDDLKPGTKAKVTARKNGNLWLATRIEATTQAASPSSLVPVALVSKLDRVTGMIKKKSENGFQLFVTADKLTVMVATSKQTEVNIDGKSATVDDLEIGHTAVVTGEKKGPTIAAKMIVAVSRR